MTRPVLNTFSAIAPIIIQHYEHYLPTAFDDSLSMLQKVNKVIKQLEKLGKLTEDIVIKWNEVMEWILNDGINEAVIGRLDEMVADGTLSAIINQEIFGELNDRLEIIEANIHNGAVDITLPPYNAVADAIYRDDLTGKWYSDSNLTVPATPMADILNLAIQDTILTGNRNIFVPSGFYYLDKTVKLIAGIRIRGAGMHYQEEHGTVFRLDGDYHALSTGLVTEDVTDMRSILLEDFMVKGNAIAPYTARTNYGLDAVHMRYNTQVNRVGFKYFKYGVSLNHVWKANFHDVLCNYCEIGVHLVNQCNRVTFYECEFNRNEISSIYSSPYGLKNESILIIGCLIEKNNGHGIRIANCEAVTIMNCYLENNHWHTILIDPIGDDFTTEVGTVNIMNNRFYGNSNYSYADTAVYIGDGGVKNVRIDGNHMNFFKEAIIRMYMNPELQVEIGQNLWGNAPNFVSYLNALGNKPIIKQAGYFNLNGNKLRGAVIESFYNNQLPTTDLYDGRMAYDLTYKCLTIVSDGVWKKISFDI